MSAPSLDLREIRKVADAASSGPWTVEPEPSAIGIHWIVDIPRAGDFLLHEGDNGEADGKFIASARTWVPALVDRIMVLEGERDDLDHELRIANGYRASAAAAEARLATAEGLLRELKPIDGTLTAWRDNAAFITHVAFTDNWLARRDAFLSNP